MRVMPVTAFLICSVAAVTAAEAHSIIVSDIDMSEWRPPSALRIDLDSGQYAVTPSSWAPPYVSKSQTRSGTVAGEKLGQLRAAFSNALSAGLSIEGCEAAHPRYPSVVGNAGLQGMSLTYNGKDMATSRIPICWTPEARTLVRLLNEYFDYKNP